MLGFFKQAECKRLWMGFRYYLLMRPACNDLHNKNMINVRSMMIQAEFLNLACKSI